MTAAIYDGLGPGLFAGISRVYMGGLSVAVLNAGGETLIAGDVLMVEPQIVVAPDILPIGAVIGDTITLSMGLAEGYPVAEASWTLTRDDLSVSSLVDTDTLTMVLDEPGVYALTVVWTSSAGSVTSDQVVLVVDAAIPDVAPEISSQPSILPQGAVIGDTVTIDPGSALGTPVPDADWDLSHNGISIKGSVDPETLTVTLAETGQYELTVNWSNRAGAVAADPVVLVFSEEDVAPSIARQPGIQPESAEVGDTITLDLGEADGEPQPVASWDFTRDGVSVVSDVDEAAMTLDIAEAGTYALAVDWSNSAGNVSAETALLTVEPEAAGVDYDTQTLAYFDAATAFSGSAANVSSINARGTGQYVFTSTGSGTAVMHDGAGFVFDDGCYMQAQLPAGQPTTDGLMAVVDFTLTGYGSNVGMLLEGAGDKMRMRDNNGKLQALAQDDTTVAISLGNTVYGTRIVIAGLMDDVLDRVEGISADGEDVSEAHDGITDPQPTRFFSGRFIKGIIHRLAVVGRAEGQEWPVTMRQIYDEFAQGA